MSFKRARTYRKRKPVARKTTKRRRTTTRRRAPVRRGSFIKDIIFNKRLGKLPRALVSTIFQEYAPSSAIEFAGKYGPTVMSGLRVISKHHHRKPRYSKDWRVMDQMAYGDRIEGMADPDNDPNYYITTDMFGNRIKLRKPDSPEQQKANAERLRENIGHLGNFFWKGVQAAADLGLTGPLTPAIKMGVKAEKIYKDAKKELRR